MSQCDFIYMYFSSFVLLVVVVVGTLKSRVFLTLLVN